MDSESEDDIVGVVGLWNDAGNAGLLVDIELPVAFWLKLDLGLVDVELLSIVSLLVVTFFLFVGVNELVTVATWLSVDEVVEVEASLLVVAGTLDEAVGSSTPLNCRIKVHAQ